MSIKMICDKQLVTDKTFMEVYNYTKERLEKLKKDSILKGSFKIDGFTFYLIGGDKNIKSTNDIEFPKMRVEGSKRKQFVTDVIREENMPPKNTYKTMITVYGETMFFEDFKIRSKIYDTFFRNHGITNSKSFKLNGIPIEVTRVPKNRIKYNVTKIDTGKIYEEQLKSQVLKITKCNKSKFTQMNKYNPIVEVNGYTIERLCSESN